MTQDGFPKYLIGLRDKIAKAFSKSELELLMFDIGIDPGSVSGEDFPLRCQNLVLHCFRREILSDLLEQCLKQRPRTNWNEGIPADDLTGNPKEVRQKASVNNPTLLLLGATGVGKTSLLATLSQRQKGQINNFEIGEFGSPVPTTRGVEIIFSAGLLGGVNFIDTPGLADRVSGDDSLYVKLLNSKAQKLSCIWLIKEITNTRILKYELDAIRLVSQAYGSKIWKCCVIVLTKADRISLRDYAETLSSIGRITRNELANYCGEDEVSNIPLVATTATDVLTPDGRYWERELLALTAYQLKN